MISTSTNYVLSISVENEYLLLADGVQTDNKDTSGQLVLDNKSWNHACP